MPVQNAEVAAMFDQGAELLEIQGENPFRVRAYRRAARAAWLALASRSWKRCVGGVAGFSMAGLSAAILTAASSNNIAKAIYAPGFGEVEFSRRSALMLFVLAILGFAAAAVYALPRSASSISNRRCIRITCNLLECAAVYNFQMPSVPALDDTARGQTSKCSAHGLKRHSNVFANI